jgi:hypothetical protein
LFVNNACVIVAVETVPVTQVFYKSQKKYKKLAMELTPGDRVNIGHMKWMGQVTGKTIKPLCTHEGRGMGRSESDIIKLCRDQK